jgi:NADH-quinone oxidoreductase subunit G
MSEMVRLTIEGREVEVPPGTSVLEAAKLAGVLIPHYCYHPSLPVAGVCRMCMVEIEKQPKLAASCATTAAPGMVVRVQSAQAKAARQSVLEFLLINHPLDCPICDQAGECELQDYVFQEGRAGTRYGEYAKRYNPVEEFGPDVLYVPNRCILCTRCVRFMDDVAQEPVLNVSERGDRAYIGVFEGEALDHAWSGNVVDLCPVGALLSKDFLHKARAWDLDRTASVCTGCTQGCNTTIETREGKVVRIKPRPNMDLNRHFMCDEGRLGYQWMNRADRLEAPMVRDAEGKLVPTGWEQALATAAALVREAKGGAVALVSAGASCEALERAAALAKAAGGRGAFRVRTGDERPLAGVPDLALRAERAPNVHGALEAGFTRDWDAAVVAARHAPLVIVLDEGLEGVDTLPAATIHVGTTLPEVARRHAAVVLPCANTAEEDGTFRNLTGRVQAYYQATSPPGMSRPAAWILGEVADLAAVAGARA